MPLLTTGPKNVFLSLNVLHFVLILANPHLPHLTIEQFIFHRLIFLFDVCMGISSVQLRNRPHNKGLTMSKMPPVATSGKLVKASKRKHACQVLERVQQQRDCRELLSLIGKNFAAAVVPPIWLQ
jgi:hypothetical protein